MGIPLYGQNKDGAILNHFADGLKVLEFDIAVATSGNADNADTGFDFPVAFLPMYSIAKNDGSVALASNAALDAGGTDITGSLNALAAGASVYLNLSGKAVATSAENILIDGGSGLVVGSSSSVLNVRIVGIDLSAVSLDDIQQI
jgi:hypothetical protein